MTCFTFVRKKICSLIGGCCHSGSSDLCYELTVRTLGKVRMKSASKTLRLTFDRPPQAKPFFPLCSIQIRNEKEMKMERWQLALFKRRSAQKQNSLHRAVHTYLRPALDGITNCSRSIIENTSLSNTLRKQQRNSNSRNKKKIRETIFDSNKQ